MSCVRERNYGKLAEGSDGEGVKGSGGFHDQGVDFCRRLVPDEEVR